MEKKIWEEMEGWDFAQLRGALALAEHYRQSAAEPWQRWIDWIEHVARTRQEEIISSKRKSVLQRIVLEDWGYGSDVQAKSSLCRPLRRAEALKLALWWSWWGNQARAVQVDRHHLPTYHKSEWIVEVRGDTWTAWFDQTNNPLPSPKAFGMTEEQAHAYESELWSHYGDGLMDIPATVQIVESLRAPVAILLVKVGRVNENRDKDRGNGLWATFYDTHELEAWLVPYRMRINEALVESAIETAGESALVGDSARIY